ncbi:MAG TPA: CaiB/BaiF CoA-transferase family protein [Acidimicrobiia bacterium]|nr:CaiB/BaiF CoA-transferase family protein [Acidimicrobiia bacterium]
MAGPLTSLKVVELVGIGPGPFAAMMLADLGADVLRIHRVESVEHGFDPGGVPVLDRNRRSVGVDLKRPEGVETVLRLVESADALLEGYRPGVTERLGVGPDPCLARNPRLVYGRMTGWGQAGPMAHTAGHDIDYIALAGALAHFGRAGEKPTPPLNMVGDFGGGGMLLAFGIVCGVIEARSSGQGQVVDAAMVDGSALLMAMMWGLRSLGAFDEANRGTNVLDSGAPFYDTYECADGAYIAVGALEPQFYAELISATGLDDAGLPKQMDRSGWPALRERFTELFLSKPRDEWCALLEERDACFAPVLTMSEAAEHPHIRARETVVDFDGVLQPAPAPRFSRTPPELRSPAAKPGEHTDSALADWGFTPDELRALHDAGAIR